MFCLAAQYDGEFGGEDLERNGATDDGIPQRHVVWGQSSRDRQKCGLVSRGDDGIAPLVVI